MEGEKFIADGFTAVENVLITRYLKRFSDFTFAELAVYTYIKKYVQQSPSTQGYSAKPNGKQGFAYTTKTRMAAELNIGKDRLNRVIDTLVRYGLVETREVKNKYGGADLTEYRPLKALSVAEFDDKYGAPF